MTSFYEEDRTSSQSVDTRSATSNRWDVYYAGRSHGSDRDSWHDQGWHDYDSSGWSGAHQGSAESGSQQPNFRENAKVPKYDGKTALRKYFRKLTLYEMNTNTPASKRAGKLIEEFTDAAWDAVETVDIGMFETEDGVERLKKHLVDELEPLEFTKIAELMQEFFDDFHRAGSQEATAYDTAFRAVYGRLKEVGCELPPLVKAYFFLKKANLDKDTRRAVLVGAGNSYEYERLRASLCAIVLKNSHHVARDEGTRGRFGRFQKGAQGVHLANDDGGGAEPEQTGGSSVGGDSALSELGEMEAEAQVLATQAKAKRAEVDKARGWSKGANPDRLKELKAKLPCTRCKGAGKIVYGHWKDDEECPERRKEAHGAHVTSSEKVSSSARAGSFLTEAVLVMALGTRETLTRVHWQSGCRLCVCSHGCRT
jgi:hypothetical protein